MADSDFSLLDTSDGSERGLSGSEDELEPGLVLLRPPRCTRGPQIAREHKGLSGGRGRSDIVENTTSEEEDAAASEMAERILQGLVPRPSHNTTALDSLRKQQGQPQVTSLLRAASGSADHAAPLAIDIEPNPSSPTSDTVHVSHDFSGITTDPEVGTGELGLLADPDGVGGIGHNEGEVAELESDDPGLPDELLAATPEVVLRRLHELEEQRDMLAGRLLSADAERSSLAVRCQELAANHQSSQLLLNQVLLGQTLEDEEHQQQRQASAEREPRGADPDGAVKGGDRRFAAVGLAAAARLLVMLQAAVAAWLAAGSALQPYREMAIARTRAAARLLSTALVAATPEQLGRLCCAAAGACMASLLLCWATGALDIAGPVSAAPAGVLLLAARSASFCLFLLALAASYLTLGLMAGAQLVNHCSQRRRCQVRAPQAPLQHQQLESAPQHTADEQQPSVHDDAAEEIDADDCDAAGSMGTGEGAAPSTTAPSRALAIAGACADPSRAAIAAAIRCRRRRVDRRLKLLAVLLLSAAYLHALAFMYVGHRPAQYGARYGAQYGTQYGGSLLPSGLRSCLVALTTPARYTSQLASWSVSRWLAAKHSCQLLTNGTQHRLVTRKPMTNSSFWQQRPQPAAALSAEQHTNASASGALHVHAPLLDTQLQQRHQEEGQWQPLLNIQLQQLCPEDQAWVKMLSPAAAAYICRKHIMFGYLHPVLNCSPWVAAPSAPTTPATPLRHYATAARPPECRSQQQQQPGLQEAAGNTTARRTAVSPVPDAAPCSADGFNSVADLARCLLSGNAVAGLVPRQQRPTALPAKAKAARASATSRNASLAAPCTGDGYITVADLVRWRLLTHGSARPTLTASTAGTASVPPPRLVPGASRDRRVAIAAAPGQSSLPLLHQPLPPRPAPPVALSWPCMRGYITARELALLSLSDGAGRVMPQAPLALAPPTAAAAAIARTETGPALQLRLVANMSTAALAHAFSRHRQLLRRLQEAVNVTAARTSMAATFARLAFGTAEKHGPIALPPAIVPLPQALPDRLPPSDLRPPAAIPLPPAALRALPPAAKPAAIPLPPAPPPPPMALPPSRLPLMPAPPRAIALPPVAIALPPSHGPRAQPPRGGLAAWRSAAVNGSVSSALGPKHTAATAFGAGSGPCWLPLKAWVMGKLRGPRLEDWVGGLPASFLRPQPWRQASNASSAAAPVHAAKAAAGSLLSSLLHALPGAGPRASSAHASAPSVATAPNTTAAAGAASRCFGFVWLPLKAYVMGRLRGPRLEDLVGGLPASFLHGAATANGARRATATDASGAEEMDPGAPSPAPAAPANASAWQLMLALASSPEARLQATERAGRAISGAIMHIKTALASASRLNGSSASSAVPAPAASRYSLLPSMGAALALPAGCGGPLAALLPAARPQAEVVAPRRHHAAPAALALAAPPRLLSATAATKTAAASSTQAQAPDRPSFTTEDSSCNDTATLDGSRATRGVPVVTGPGLLISGPGVLVEEPRRRGSSGRPGSETKLGGSCSSLCQPLRALQAELGSWLEGAPKATRGAAAPGPNAAGAGGNCSSSVYRTAAALHSSWRKLGKAASRLEKDHKALRPVLGPLERALRGVVVEPAHSGLLLAAQGTLQTLRVALQSPPCILAGGSSGWAPACTLSSAPLERPSAAVTKRLTRSLDQLVSEASCQAEQCTQQADGSLAGAAASVRQARACLQWQAEALNARADEAQCGEPCSARSRLRRALASLGLPEDLVHTALGPELGLALDARAFDLEAWLLASADRLHAWLAHTLLPAADGEGAGAGKPRGGSGSHRVGKSNKRQQQRGSGGSGDSRRQKQQQMGAAEQVAAGWAQQLVQQLLPDPKLQRLLHGAADALRRGASAAGGHQRRAREAIERAASGAWARATNHVSGTYIDIAERMLTALQLAIRSAYANAQHASGDCLCSSRRSPLQAAPSAACASSLEGLMKEAARPSKGAHGKTGGRPKANASGATQAKAMRSVALELTVLQDRLRPLEQRLACQEQAAGRAVELAQVALPALR